MQTYSAPPCAPIDTVVLIPVPWWRQAGHLARIGMLVLGAHLVVLLAFEPLRAVSYLAVIASVAAIVLLPRPGARIGWQDGRIQIRAGRHRWATPAESLDLDAAKVVAVPPPGPDSPEPGRGEVRRGTYLGPGRWPSRGINVFCACRTGEALLVPVSPTQALLLQHPAGPEQLRERLRLLLRQQPA